MRWAELEINARDHYLEVHLYPPPNPALAEILLSGRMEEVIWEYAAQVAAAYAQKMAPRPRIGDKHPFLSTQSVKIDTPIGGAKHDRKIGEITVEVEYASADEFGRKAFNPYEGHHDLANALYSILPPT